MLQHALTLQASLVFALNKYELSLDAGEDED